MGGFDIICMTQPEQPRPSGSVQHAAHPSVPDTLLEQVPELLVARPVLQSPRSSRPLHPAVAQGCNWEHTEIIQQFSGKTLDTNNVIAVNLKAAC